MGRAAHPPARAPDLVRHVVPHGSPLGPGVSDDHKEAAIALEHKVREAVADAIRGSDWEPPGAVLTECVVVMGWFLPDGSHGSSHLRCGTPWGTLGLVSLTKDRIEAQEAADLFDEDE